MPKKIFTKNGRTAFKGILDMYGLKAAGKSILVPAYIGITDAEGSGVLDPIEAAGVTYEFYAVDKSLAPVLKDLEAKIKSPDVGAVLVVHYFGFPPANFDAVVALCRAEQKLLFEDCAHALNSWHQGKQLGTFGDASFFSIHKYLSTNGGGILQINKEPAAPYQLPEETIDPSDLAAYQEADFEKTLTTRRDNYLYLESKLGNIKPFFPALPEGVAPMNFPIWTEGVNRDDYFFKLQEKQIKTTTLYYRLVPQISEDLFPVSFEISRHISNLPIHQDITHEYIDRMLEAVTVELGKK